MPDIFLSYSREDAATARRFADAFARDGFDVWWDATLRSGEAYDQVTEKALRDAKAVVVLWSRASVDSRWVRAEATLADRNRTLVPAMIEPCERPIMFELTQTADLIHWNGDRDDAAWRAFVADVRRFARKAATGPESPASAPDAFAATSRSTDHRPSLAILPFTNRSGEAADDVFAEGMVEDLISALSLGGTLKVIAQSATIVFRKNVSDLRSIGEALGVRYLLEGNVRRIGSTLRVSAQLVESDHGAILWTQRFDRPLTELARLQEDLVTEVASHLGVQVEIAEMRKALAKPGDLTAWEAVMRSLSSAGMASRDGLQFGIVEARKAIAIAPNYAMAHAALAYNLANLFFAVEGGRPEHLAREARSEAEKALRLDSGDPAVLSWSALALGYSGFWREALTQAKRSLELNPNLAATHQVLAQCYIRLNRPEDALTHADAASSLAPRGFMSHLGPSFAALAHLLAGRYERALAASEQSLQFNPGFRFAWKDMAVILFKLGRTDEAREAMHRFREIDQATSLEDLQAANKASFIAPEAIEDMNSIIGELWGADA